MLAKEKFSPEFVYTSHTMETTGIMFNNGMIGIKFFPP